MVEKNKTTQVNFRVSEELLEKIDKYASCEYMDRTAFIRKSVLKEIQRIDGEELLERRRLAGLKAKQEETKGKISKLKSKKSLNNKEKGLLFDLLESYESAETELVTEQMNEINKYTWKEEFEELENEREIKRKKFIESY